MEPHIRYFFMNIEKLHLYNFKNAYEETLEFAPGVNIIYGENASGKTNLLEALFYFASGKSFRGGKERELIRLGEEKASAEVRFTSRGSAKKMSLALEKGKKRVLSVDGVKVAKLSEYLGLFRAVIFTPDHLHLVKGVSENRRRFLDLAICQSFPRYAASLNEYGRLLIQKNALLRGESPDEALLGVYHDRMAHLWGIITLNRWKYLANLESAAAEFQTEMSMGAEKLELKYRSQLNPTGEYPAETLKEKAAVLLEQKAKEEIRRGFAVTGPQRDDFDLYLNGLNCKMFGSQGQQRSSVLSLKLAEGELSKRLTGEYPVFLLDDILSELDVSRRSYILDKIVGKQVVLTGCESELFDGYGECNRIYVEKGVARNV